MSLTKQIRVSADNCCTFSRISQSLEHPVINDQWVFSGFLYRFMSHLACFLSFHHALCSWRRKGRSSWHHKTNPSNIATPIRTQQEATNIV